MSAARARPEPPTRRTWLLVVLVLVLFWAWVLVAQRRVEARHPESVHSHGPVQLGPVGRSG